MFCLIAYKNPRADDPACRHSGLGITASNLAEVLNDNNLSSLAQPFPNGEAIWRCLNKRPDVTHVVLCAPFFDTEFLEKMCRAFPFIRFTVTYHSNYGFLGQDRWAVKCLVKQVNLQSRVRNFQVSGNCAPFTGSTAVAFRTAVMMLPNLYYLHGAVNRARAVWTHGDLHVGIFGATRILKNIMTGVVAAWIIGRELRAQQTFVHVSTGRVEHGDGVLEAIRALFTGERQFTLVEEPWANWPDFRVLVRQMNITLQPSYSESHNNTAVDSIVEGVPIVAGNAIKWLPKQYQGDPDDARSLAEVGLRLMKEQNATQAAHDAIVKYNNTSLKYWRAWLLG